MGASVAVLMLVVLAARPAAAQVLEQVPADALAVLKVKNLQATSGKIAKYANDLGLAALAPPLNDPLKALEDKLKISQGINASGDMFVAFMNPGEAEGEHDKAIVILFPVSDYKAFLANFPDSQTDGEVTQVKMADSPDPGFIANWGTFAAISPSKDLVAKKPDMGLKLTPAGDKELTAKDISIYANFAEIRTVVGPKLTEARGQILSEADAAIKKAPNGEKFAPIVHAVVDQVLNIADSILRDTDAATFGIQFGDEGLSTTLMGDFKPGSYIGNTTDPLLGGLPLGKYLVFGGFVMDPAMASKAFSDLVDPVAKEIATAGPDMQSINDYVAAAKGIIAATKGASLGMFAPTGALGQEALAQAVAVYNGDPKAMADSVQKAVAVMPDVMKALGLPADAYKVTLTHNAKTLDGVSFDSITTVMTPDPNNPMAQQQAQMMALMYGPNGMTEYTGIVGDHLLVATGVSDAVLSTAIASAKSGESPLSALDAVKKASANLPTNRMAEAFVPLDQIISTGLVYAKQFGFAMPVQLPPDLPPIGETLSTDASTVKLDSYVPTSLVQSLVAAGMQAFMQMNGGGAGGGM
jgi:hypothetical protein